MTKIGSQWGGLPNRVIEGDVNDLRSLLRSLLSHHRISPSPLSLGMRNFLGASREQLKVSWKVVCRAQTELINTGNSQPGVDLGQKHRVFTRDFWIDLRNLVAQGSGLGGC